MFINSSNEESEISNISIKIVSNAICGAAIRGFLVFFAQYCVERKVIAITINDNIILSVKAIGINVQLANINI
jgi:hypothetical protein